MTRQVISNEPKNKEKADKRGQICDLIIFPATGNFADLLDAGYFV